MLFQNNEEFYKAILSEMPGEIAVFDTEWRYIFVNSQAIRNNEIREWIIGKTDREYCAYRKFDMSVADGREARFKTVEKEKKEFEWEEHIVDKLGNEHIYIRRLSPIFNEFGLIVNFIGYGIEITERRKERAELEASRNLLDQIINTSPHLIFVKDRDGRFLMVNQATADLFGTDIQSVIKRFNDEIHPHKEETDHYANVDRRVTDSMESIRVEERFTRYDGKLLWYDTIKVPFKQKDGKVHVLAISTDITERKEAEIESEVNHQRMLDAQDLLMAGSWEVNVVTNAVDWSPGMYKLFEMDPSEPPLNASNWRPFIHPGDHENFHERMQELRITSEPIELEFRLVVPSGTKMVRIRAKAYFSEVGKIIRVFGTLKDITAQKEIEEKARSNEQQLIEAQELAKMGSWSFDPWTEKSEWSHGHYLIWELPEKNGPPSYPEYLAMLHPDDRQRMIDLAPQLVETGVADKNEYRIVMPDGRVKWIESTVKLLKSDEGKVMRFFGTSLDVTERKEFEQKLIEANRKAEASVRAKEIFLANVGHELRTPLNGVLGLAKLMQKTALTHTQRNYIDILNRSASNLLLIINDILDIAKIESGTLSIEKMVFDPGVVAETAVLTQLYKAEEKDINLRHMKGNGTLPKVLGDPLRLNQILLNLLSNAIKFTEQGEVVVSHNVRHIDPEHVVIEFSVRDTGVGIPKSKLDAIFESFTQITDARGRFEGGTGLGLSICRHLLELQGGSIRVESASGEGSCFWFEIPYELAKETENEQQDDARKVDPNQLSYLRILLAEDNRVNQFITEAMLRDWGFKVEVAVNGAEAVQFVQQNNYDLVLMDIQMPVLNGVEATQQIRKLSDSRKARLPIIALTANTGKAAQKKFLLEGMNDCLVKPFKEEDLLRVILSHLEGSEKLQLPVQKRFPQRRKPIGSEQPLYNLNMLYKDAQNDPAFVAKMLQIFVETIPPIVVQMHDHFERGEMEAVGTLAHKIKPTLHGAGIAGLFETIRNIEGYRDKKRSREQLKSDLEHLSGQIDLVTEAFRAEIERLRA